GNRVARRDDDHGDLVAPGAQPAQHVEAALPRQPEVEEHAVVGLGAQRRLGRRAVLHPVDAEAVLAQPLAHRLPHHAVVFHEEEPHQLISTGTKIFASSRWMRSATTLPAFSVAARSSAALRTGLPFTARITSPSRIPACAAGPLDCSTTRPAESSACLFSSSVSGRTASPSLPPSAERLEPAEATFSGLSSPTVTWTSFFAPLCQISKLALLPGLRSATRGGSSLERSIGLPSMESSTSPGWMPALAAGPFLSTEPTSAPVGFCRPKDSASGWVSSWMPTPMRPRCTEPCSTSCVSTFFATSIGMAKASPW